jgi:plastocyanin
MPLSLVSALFLQEGVNAEALSRDEYLNAPGESFTAKFDTPGTYGYYCEPHQGAGMVGKVIVQ